MIWTTKDGRQINVRDMSEQHFHNTIQMLRRKAEDEHANARYGICYWGDPDGMGAYYAEAQGFEHLERALEIENRIEALKRARTKRSPRGL